MAGIMDPWAYDHLLPPPPAAFEDLTIEQMDDYFRAVGILPPLPPADAVVVVPAPGYTAADATFWGAMDYYDVKLPPTRDVHAVASFEAQAAQFLQFLAAEAHAAPFAAPVAPANFAVKVEVAPFDIDASLRCMKQEENTE